MIAAGCLCLRGDGAMRLTRVGLVDTRAAELRISMVGACCFRVMPRWSRRVIRLGACESQVLSSCLIA